MSVENGKFPLIPSPEDRKTKELPSFMPWGLIAPYEAQAWKNHRQTLATLAGRGGCEVREIYCIMHNKSYDRSLTYEDARDWLIDLLNRTVTSEATTETPKKP